jgi:hypothetical protein
MNLRGLFAFFFFVLLITTQVHGYQYHVAKQLDNSWYCFDDNQRYLSFEESSDQQKAFLTLDNSYPKSSILKMSVGKNTSIYIGTVIVAYYNADTTLSYRLDSLFETVLDNPSQLTLTLFNPEGVEINGSKILTPMIGLDYEQSTPIFRIVRNQKDALLIIILIIAAALTYLKIGHVDIWRGYMKWSRLITIKDQGAAIYKIRPFEKGTIIIVLIYGMVSAVVIMALSVLMDLKFIDHLLFNSQSLTILLLIWVVLSLMLFTLAFAKYLLVKIFTKLFVFKGASRIHFYNHIKISLLFALLVLLISLIGIYSLSETGIGGWIHIAVIGLLLMKTFLISLKLFRISAYGIYHLFSYLCATELIPSIILIKVTFLI